MVLPSYKYNDTWWFGFEDLGWIQGSDWDYEDYIIRITNIYQRSQGNHSNYSNLNKQFALFLKQAVLKLLQ